MSTVSSNSVAVWRCGQCLLFNSANMKKCEACELSITKEAENFFEKICLSMNIPLEKLDSSLVSTQIYSPSFDPMFAITANWHCLNCSRINKPPLRFCHFCSYDYNNDSLYMSWACDLCGMKLPHPPSTFKCPLCNVHAGQPITFFRSTIGNDLSLAASKSSFDYAHLAHYYTPTASSSSNDSLDDAFVPVTSKLYDDVMKFCTLYNECFVDDAFPPSERSLGKLEDLDCSKIVWLRSTEIETLDKSDALWSVFNNPDPTDIVQGVLGDCWFLSALALVAERPEILEKLFITKQYNHFGVYEIRLCIDGIWHTVVVDDFFPCFKSTKKLAFAVGHRNQLWVSLIEKALAKIHGNYGSLNAGCIQEGLSILTGAPSEVVYIPNSMDEFALDHLWAKLLSAKEASFLMGCSSFFYKHQVDRNELCIVGLRLGHGYSILDVRQLDAYRLVRIRNPWGQVVWLGEWSDNWPGWEVSDARNRLGSDSSAPGTFWMPFEAFTKYFTKIEIALICEHAGWIDTRYKVDIGWQEGKTKALRLTVTESTEVIVMCFPRNSRTVSQPVDTMVSIFRESNPSSYLSSDGASYKIVDDVAVHLGELVARSRHDFFHYSYTSDVLLTPGNYIVVATSLAKFVESCVVPATIVVHSAKQIFVEVLSVPLEILRDSLISIILKDGVLLKSAGGCVIRCFTYNFYGLAIMVDNYSTNQCVQLIYNCEDSVNVLSSRSALNTVDSIPPMHRQVVQVITEFDSNNKAVMSHRYFQRLTRFAQLRDLLPKHPEAQNFPALTTPALITLHAPTPITWE